jgi:hypothetical protein
MALDLVRLVNSQMKPFMQMFVINPRQWRKFATTTKLSWNKVKFTAGNKASVPRSRGLYAFVAENNECQLPPHGYVMYVGIAGDTSTHTLRDRYGNYLRDKKVKKRAGIHYMLNNWGAGLYFHYALVADKRLSLHKLEKSISDTMMPPFSTNDFSVEIREAKKAF